MKALITNGIGIQPPNDNYYRLEDMLGYTLFKKKDHNGFNILKADPELAAQVSEYLAGLGFKRFCYLGSGSYAVVFKTTDDQLIRIASDKVDNVRVKHPAILQPIHTHVIGDARIEILPRVHSLSTDDSDQFSELHKLFEDGKYNIRSDYSIPNNLGTLDDGTPIIIDGGTIEATDACDKDFNNKEYDKWMTKDDDGNRIWRQHAAYPGIVTGELAGVIPNEQLKELIATRGNKSTICRAAEAGLYSGEIGHILEKSSNGNAANFPRRFAYHLKKHLDGHAGPEDTSQHFR